LKRAISNSSIAAQLKKIKAVLQLTIKLQLFHQSQNEKHESVGLRMGKATFHSPITGNTVVSDDYNLWLSSKYGQIKLTAVIVEQKMPR
jgi:hypothetical protein